MFKLFYLYLAAQQLLHGYPLFRHHDPFTRAANTLNVLFYKIYRGVPFVWDLRVMLDWTFTSTTLRFYDYLKVEDIFHETFVRYGNIITQEGSNPKRGSNYPIAGKLIDGGIMFVLLMTIIFFPLGFYSAFNPGLGDNPVTSLEMTVSLGSYGEVYSSTEYYIQDKEVESLQRTGASRTRPAVTQSEFFATDKYFQVLELEQCSSSLWQLSPTSELQLLSQLAVLGGLTTTNREMVAPLTLDTTLTVTRTQAAAGGAQTQVLRHSVDIDAPLARKLYTELVWRFYNGTNPRPPIWRTAAVNLTFIEPYVGGSANSNFNITGAVWTNSSAYIGLLSPGPNGVEVDAFIDPFLLNQPATVVPLQASIPGTQSNCNLSLRSEVSLSTGTTVRYWCISCQGLFSGGIVPTPADPESPCSLYNFQCGANSLESSTASQGRPLNASSPFFVIASDQVPTKNNLVPIDVGIIALYTTFIFAIGGLIRGTLTGMSHRIVLEDVAEPRCIAELLGYIYLSRGSTEVSEEVAALEAEPNDQPPSTPTSGQPPAQAEPATGQNDLDLEEQIFMELLDLLRAPDQLKRVTGRRVDTYTADGWIRVTNSNMQW